MADQQKATSLDLYSERYGIRTTSLSDLAAHGAVFGAAYCPTPLCVPSRIATLTGRYPAGSGYVGAGPLLGTRSDTIFAQAKRAGYHTLLVGKDHAVAHMHDPAAVYGGLFDRVYAAAHLRQTEVTRREQPHIQPFIDGTAALRTLWGSAVAPWESEESVTARLCDVAVEYLEAAPKAVPFAMWLSFPDPHEPYQVGRDAFAEVGEVPLYPNRDPADLATRAEYIGFMHWYFNAGGVPEAVKRQLLRVYLGMCLTIDRQLEKVFAALRRSGRWEDTVIVYTADHGDLTGEHGLLQKFNCGYDGCCRVPLLIAQPGRSAPRRVAHPVSLVDLPATLCELLEWPRLGDDQGESLAPLLAGGGDDLRPYRVVESGVPGESLSLRDIRNFPLHRWDVEPQGRWSYDPPHRFGGKLYAVRSERYKLIVREGQAQELYDLQRDPWEQRNLAEVAALQPVILEHYRYLTEHLGRVVPRQPGTAFAPQDAFYRAGGELTWDESRERHRTALHKDEV